MVVEKKLFADTKFPRREARKAAATELDGEWLSIVYHQS